MMKLRAFLAILGTVFLTACETPNLQPWAESTATLAAAVSTEHQAVLTRMTGAQAKINAWHSKDKRADKLGQQINTYKTNAKKIEAVLDLAVDYSNALTELAKAGESGEDAANKIIGSFKKFTEIANVAFPGASASGEIIGDVFRSVSDAITRIQAQKSLGMAMNVAENGNPEKNISGPVPVIADQLTEMFKSKGGVQRQIVSGFRRTEDGIDLDIAGFNEVAFYRGVAVKKKEISGVSATLIGHFYSAVGQWVAGLEDLSGACFAQELDKDDPTNPSGKTLQKLLCLPQKMDPEALIAINTLVRDAKANNEAFAKAQAENAKFARQRLSAADKIVEAVKSWRDEHKRIADKLKECGGLKALRKSCGNLTFTNFKSAAEKLKAIAGKGDN